MLIEFTDKDLEILLAAFLPDAGISVQCGPESLGLVLRFPASYPLLRKIPFPMEIYLHLVPHLQHDRVRIDIRNLSINSSNPAGTILARVASTFRKHLVSRILAGMEGISGLETLPDQQALVLYPDRLLRKLSGKWTTGMEDIVLSEGVLRVYSKPDIIR